MAQCDNANSPLSPTATHCHPPPPAGPPGKDLVCRIKVWFLHLNSDSLGHLSPSLEASRVRLRLSGFTRGTEVTEWVLRGWITKLS